MDQRVQGPDLRLSPRRDLLQPPGEPDDGYDRQRHGHEREQRETPIERDGHAEQDQDLEAVPQVRGESVGDRELDGGDVAGEACQQISRGAASEERGGQLEQLLVQREPQVGDHALAEHAHAVELAEVGDPAHRGDGEDEDRERAQHGVARERFRSAEERQRAAQRLRVEGAALEDELEHRSDQPGERARRRREHDHRGNRCREQAEMRPYRREKTPIFLHARLVARGFS